VTLTRTPSPPPPPVLTSPVDSNTGLTPAMQRVDISVGKKRPSQEISLEVSSPIPAKRCLDFSDGLPNKRIKTEDLLLGHIIDLMDAGILHPVNVLNTVLDYCGYPRRPNWIPDVDFSETDVVINDPFEDSMDEEEIDSGDGEIDSGDGDDGNKLRMRRKAFKRMITSDDSGTNQLVSLANLRIRSEFRR